MATAYEIFVKHMKLAIRQMEQLTKLETEIDEDEVCDLMSKLSKYLLIELLA